MGGEPCCPGPAPASSSCRKMAAAAELTLLEKSLGLSKGNKYSAQGERQIPVLQTNNGPSLTGLTTIAAHLVKQANKEYLLGSTAEEKAIVQQWLEYRVTRVDGHSNKDDIRTLLKDLNSYLEDKVYLTGYNFTLADILLYYGLHRFIILFISGNTQRGKREAETQAEGEAGAMQGARRGTRSWVSRIRPWAEGGAKPLEPPGLPCFILLKYKGKI
ncbi:eukaryotic translation elongation factor 1 epsilon-1 isoform X1 [Vulpes vulpes]|uniref:Eukaryotic translation elongation factor 1 epsilon-1 isoform X1 n=1 Tax=Vulpes vulpes TaxID=9627 RepID=A0ABM4Y4N7_VULVU